jgi:hypothetical protein
MMDKAIEAVGLSQTGDPFTDPTPFILTNREIENVVRAYLTAMKATCTCGQKVAHKPNCLGFCAFLLLAELEDTE